MISADVQIFQNPDMGQLCFSRAQPPSSRVEFSVPVPDYIKLEYFSKLLDLDGALRDLLLGRISRLIELDQALQLEDRELSISTLEHRSRRARESEGGV